MGRIRTIKPEFWKHEDLCALPESTHLLAAALLNYADDFGYFNANPALVKAECSPLREPLVSIPESLRSLQEIGFIALGKCEKGRSYGRIVSFDVHQRVSHPSKSKIADLSITWGDSGNPPEILRNPPEILRPEQGTGNREQGTGNKKRAVAHVLRPAGVDQQVWEDFVAQRKTQRAPITETALRRITDEAEKAGITLGNALEICLQRGWRGFEADWVAKKLTDPQGRVSDAALQTMHNLREYL
jgi:hypothetical protein